MKRTTVLAVVAALLLMLRPAAALELRNPEADVKPLVIYYSLSGTTEIVALELSRALGCELLELTSLRKRKGFWKINCVVDQLFDRDDLPGPVELEAGKYNPVIIASPIWIHRFASPVRTFLNNQRLEGKTAYAIVTHQGNCGIRDEKAVRRFLELQGMHCAGYGAVLTRGRTKSEIADETKRFIEINFPEMKTVVLNITQ